MTAANMVDIRQLLDAGEDAVLAGWTSDGDNAEIERSGSGVAHTALDRVAQIGAVLIDNEQTVLLAEATATLVRLFRAAQDVPVREAGTRQDVVRAERWRDIAIRAYSLGALAVLRSHFTLVPNLVLQQSDPVRSGKYWLRATVTALARATPFQRNSLLPLIADHIADRDVLYRRFHRNKDQTVNALCQFDFLQCVLSVAATNSLSECYPNFGAFFNERTEPVVDSLVKGGPARAAAPDLSDERLASIIVKLDDLANEQFFAYAGWHRADWTSEAVRSFLRKHAPQ